MAARTADFLSLSSRVRCSERDCAASGRTAGVSDGGRLRTKGIGAWRASNVLATALAGGVTAATWVGRGATAPVGAGASGAARKVPIKATKTTTVRICFDM